MSPGFVPLHAKPARRAGYTDPHMQAATIDLGSLGQHLMARGYTAETLHQHWRHVVGAVRDSHGQRLFFKLATTPEVGRFTQNELRWNERIGKLLAKGVASFKVPAIYSHGMLDGKFYYLGEYSLGRPLPSLDPQQRHRVGIIDRDTVVGLARLAIALSELPDVELWELHGRDLHQQIDRYFAHWPKWINSAQARHAPPELVSRSEQLRTSYRPSLAHGDFSLGNVLLEAPDYYTLIDAEHAYSGWPAWYDIANMAHRLGTRGDVQLADEFLKAARIGLSAKDVPFSSELGPVLAYCAVRGFHELEIDGLAGIALEKHLEFARYIVQRSYLN